MLDKTHIPAEDAPIRRVAHPLQTITDLDPLMAHIGDARFVLLGEATHGTSEFYLWRARLSQRLIQEKSFSLIAVEGEWPDCYRVNRYIKHYDGAGGSARQVLNTFARWPTWMWANWEVVALVEWLRQHNASLPEQQRVGFYGLDVYSLWESLGEVMHYLEGSHPTELEAAYRAYSCFQPYGEDAQAYAIATRFVSTSCEDEVIDLLVDLQKRVRQLHDGTYGGDHEAAFNAEQNARVAVGAERYYRTMVRGDNASWNLRDTHMVETLERLVDHYGPTTKAIVWEHNTHIGDARATNMGDAGLHNVGQLVRERRGHEGVRLVGQGTYWGSVIAARGWGAPMETMPVPEARARSWEGILHRTLGEDSLLIFAQSNQATQANTALQQMHGHRAIGVVHYPGDSGGFVPTALSQRYDAFIYLEESQALHPLHLEPVSHQPPETYPWGV